MAGGFGGGAVEELQLIHVVHFEGADQGEEVLVLLVEEQGKGDLARQEGDVAVFVDLGLEAFFGQGIETEFLVHGVILFPAWPGAGLGGPGDQGEAAEKR